MNARLRLQIQRVFHLVEGRRHTAFLHPIMDEEQQFFLFLSQHAVVFP